MQGAKKVAFVLNEQSPYRIHKLLRFAREIPEIAVRSLLTRHRDNFNWQLAPPPEINQISFDENGQSRRGRLGMALGDWKRAGRIIRWMADWKVDAVVVFGYGDAGQRRIIRWASAHGVPCMVWGDSNILGERTSGARHFLKKIILPRLLRRCDAILACGRRGRQYFEAYGVPSDRIFLVPNEPDYGLWQKPDAGQLAAVRDKLGLRPERHRLVFSGRLAAAKRVDLLIDAFSAIADVRADWDLLIVGDGPLSEQLHARVPAGYRQRVQWAGFVSTPAEVGAIYACCDALVLPSDYEPWALVINEAAAAGLAIISSDVAGAAAEIVRNGVNGRFFPAGDLAALREALLDVTDATKTRAMRAASPQVLQEWREKADPVEGLRSALRACGVMQDQV